MIATDTLHYLNMCDMQGFEWPTNFDLARSKGMVTGLKSTLDTLLPGEVQRPDAYEAQDCTFFARLRLPVEISVGNYQSDLYVSNFGDMTAVQNEGFVLPEYLDTIKRAAERNGFRWINEADLLRTYDGKGKWGFSTWWHRFFDYV